VENIASIDYPNVEIIVSDRHCDDEALDVLERTRGADARISFLRGAERLDWVAHYNFLLAAGKGKYFLWMPHDDHYPSGYITALVEALESDSAAVLAYGVMESETEAGLRCVSLQLRIQPNKDGRWSAREAGRLMARGNEPGVAFRGVFRRDVVIRHGLFIRATAGLVMADVYWLFALGLLGRFRFVPQCICRKRYRRGSAHAQWRYDFRAKLEGLLVAWSYLGDQCASHWDRVYLMAVFSLWTLRRMSD
jgi:GT2 family glycosyltransferase